MDRQTDGNQQTKNRGEPFMPFHSHPADVAEHVTTSGPAFWAAMVAFGVMAGRKITAVIRPTK